MKIKDLKRGGFEGSIEGEITELEEVKEIQGRFGNKLTVANGTLTDDSGEIKIALWNEDTAAYSKGDKIRISDGWVSEFQEELKVSPGRNGKIEKI